MKNPAHNGGAGFGLSGGQTDFTSSIKLLHAQNHNQQGGFSYLTLAGLRSMAKNPRIGSKASAPIFAPHNGTAKTKDAAIAAQFHALILDFDDGGHDAGSIQDLLRDVAFLAWTSASHTPTEPRWKVIIPFSRAIHATAWISIAGGAALTYGADPAQARVQQICYVPNKLAEAAPYAVIDKLDGNPLDPTGSLAQAFEAAFEASREQVAANATPKASNAPKGSTDIIRMVNQAYDVRSVLEQHGYQKRDKKYLAPNSKSGFPGVHVLAGDDGRERVFSHHSLESDPIADGHSHDVFDLLVEFRFHGNVGEAVKTLAAELDPDGQAQRQRDYMAAQDAAGGTENNEPFSFARFSINGKSKVMKLKMLGDIYVMNRIALLGQITVIYAKPNTGKTLLTLRMLIDSVKNAIMKGEDIYYINADDSYKGLVHKLELCEEVGIHMVAPGENGFAVKHLAEYLSLMIRQDTARGKVIVLDTLKKVVDLMDKKQSSDFMSVARQFVQKGGSLILLAHVNKKRDGDGKVIAGGTSDVSDDADCVYLLDEVSVEGDTKTVKFENTKARGDVAQTLSLTYERTEGMPYRHLLDSVKIMDEQDIAAATAKRLERETWEEDQPTITALKQAIQQGHTIRGQLIKAVVSDSGISRRNTIAALDRRTGHLAGNPRYPFIEEVGTNNARVYKAWEHDAVLSRAFVHPLS